MPTRQVVEQGECISSIAAAEGMDPKKIWQDSQNNELRSKRSSPNILNPNDEVIISDKEPKEESGGTEAKHRFKKKGTPVRLRLRFLDEDKPRSGEQYLLLVDELEMRGKTDSDGGIEQKIPATATRAILRLGPQDSGEDYVLQIGSLDPIEELSGIQARLYNLGFYHGEVDGVGGPNTERALRQFQQKSNLCVTGEPDSQTREKLKKAYGC